LQKQLTLPPLLHRHQPTSRRRDLIVAVADVSALLRASIYSCKGSSPCRRLCIVISRQAFAVISSSLSLMSERCCALQVNLAGAAHLAAAPASSSADKPSP
jgi:hypothetical protein